jgi:hypothetical protein
MLRTKVRDYRCECGRPISFEEPAGNTPLLFGIKVVVFDTEQDCVSYIAKQAIIGNKVTFFKN